MSGANTPQFGVIGISANASIISDIAMNGARMNVNLSTNGGVQSSLKKILIMSAITWPKPNGPIRFGP